MLLLVGAGLLIRSLQQLAAIRPGYDAGHVLALRVSLPRLAPAAPEGADARTVVTARGVLERVAQVPGVEQTAVGSDVPLAGSGAIFYTAEGQPPVTAQNIPRAYIHRASPGFFAALHIPFTAGRTFTEQEMQGTSNVAIVSEAVVKRFWPGQDPIGKRIKPGDAQSRSQWWTIVGVVNDMKYRGLPENPTADPDVFVPFSERQRQFALLVRTTLDPASLAPAVRRAVREADSSSVVYGVSTMEKMIAGETARFRFTGWLMGIFAASALLLALIGIYGVMSYTVARRTQEIGIRVALGAGSGDVLRLVVGRGAALIVGGLGLGVAGALGLTRLMRGLLYGVTATDLASFAAASLLLAVVAVAACLIPAARASRIQPAIALRSE
jgi:putative ABC transport system permease protein